MSLTQPPVKRDPRDPLLVRLADKGLEGTGHFIEDYAQNSGKRYAKAVDKGNAVSSNKVVKDLNDKFNTMLLASVLVAGPLGPLAFFLLKEAALGAADAAVAMSKQAGKDVAVLGAAGLFAGTIWAGKKLVQADAWLGERIPEIMLHNQFEQLAKNIKTARGQGFMFDMDTLRSGLNVFSTNLGLPEGSRFWADDRGQVRYEHKDPATGQLQSLHGRPSVVVIGKDGGSVAQIWHDNGIVQKAAKATEDGRVEIRMYNRGTFSLEQSRGFLADNNPGAAAKLIADGATIGDEQPQETTMGVSLILDQAKQMKAALKAELEKAVARGDRAAVQRLEQAGANIDIIGRHAHDLAALDPSMTVTVESTSKTDFASIERTAKQVETAARLKADADDHQPHGLNRRP